MSEPYKLYYWPGLPGRGEFVRLVLEVAGAPYVDVARQPEAEGGGIPAILGLLQHGSSGQPAFAPPILMRGDLCLAQTAAICDYLGECHHLAPKEPEGRARALQLFLTILDVLDEVHNTHHPLAKSLYYEDQKEAALHNAKAFLKDRLPKLVGYFERCLTYAGGHYLLGTSLSYVDLGLYQLLLGLKYAFPEGTKRALDQTPQVAALGERVAAVHAVSAFKASKRSVGFTLDGIFRYYPELDFDGS